VGAKPRIDPGSRPSGFAELFGATTVRDIIRATPLASAPSTTTQVKEEVYQAIRDDVALAIRPRLREEYEAKTVEGDPQYLPVPSWNRRRRSSQFSYHPPHRRHHPRASGYCRKSSPALRSCAKTSRETTYGRGFQTIDADFHGRHCKVASGRRSHDHPRTAIRSAAAFATALPRGIRTAARRPSLCYNGYGVSDCLPGNLRDISTPRLKRSRSACRMRRACAARCGGHPS
jgi:hypothetical protein